MRAAAAFVVTTVGLALAPSAVRTQSPPSSETRPLPSAETLYAEVRANLARADREQFRYAYREKRSELHTNPFGKIGTDGTLTYEVVPGSEVGIYQRRLIERDGKPVTPQKAETLDRRERGKGNNSSIEDVVAMLEFKIRGRELRGGRECIVIDFHPKKDANPQTKQGKIARIFKGTVWVDETLREVVRVEATSIDDLSYGLGLVAKLNEGTHATLVREPIDGSLWLPTSIVLKG
jgi:hypothetical protein